MTIINYEDSDFEELANDFAEVTIRLMALEGMLKSLHPSITEVGLQGAVIRIRAQIDADKQRREN